MYTEYNDQFQIFAAIALFLLIVELLLWKEKTGDLQNIRLFKFKV